MSLTRRIYLIKLRMLLQKELNNTQNQPDLTNLKSESSYLDTELKTINQSVYNLKSVWGTIAALSNPLNKGVLSFSFDAKTTALAPFLRCEI